MKESLCNFIASLLGACVLYLSMALQTAACTFIALFLLINTNITNADPVIKGPSFQQLSTANGLSQDTVNALTLDNEGFLWLGTQAGLNRYDGYQNIQITGTNNEFIDVTITALFQDSKGNMWIGETIGGVHRYDLASNHSELILSAEYISDPNYTQEANEITEDSNGDIWFSLDESIVRYSYVTQTTSREFVLPPEIVEHEIIRTHATLPDFLIVGYTSGLVAFNRQTKHTIEIPYLDEEDKNIDNINVKRLVVDNSDNLWIGTVEGLFRISLTQLLSYLQNETSNLDVDLVIPERNIWQMASDKHGIFHIATDIGYYQLDPTNKEAKLVFLPSDSRYFISDDTLKSVIVDKNNNIWLGSDNDGAIYWTQYATEFDNIFNQFGGRGDKVLSNNNVWSLYQQDDETLWVGTKNGLNKYNLLTGETEHFLEYADQKAESSSASIRYIHPLEDNQLLLNTSDGLIKFDTITNKTSPIISKNESASTTLNGFIWSSHRDANGDLLIVTEDNLLRYSDSSNELTPLEGLTSVITPQETMGFVSGNTQNTSWVSVYGELWQMNHKTGELTLVHRLDSEHKKALIYPSDVIVDKNGILWVAYPSLGLFGLDATSYEQKYFFDKNNALPTNVIFDLNIDREGDIWMASNTGLLHLSTDSLQVERFDQNSGLSTSDFNLDASIVLNDGRMAYGSSKGLTIFDPKNIEPASNKHSKTAITNVTLSTNSLNLPFKILNNQTLELAHDDVGLNIHFSTLQYENQKSIKYRYELKGDENISYPVTSDANIMFPRLEPGKYQFEVAKLDLKSKGDFKPAVLNIVVHYPPLLSPLAYAIYALTFLSLLGLFLKNKRKQNRALAIAHQQTLETSDRLTLALSASNSGVWEFNLDNDLFWVNKIDSHETQPITRSFQDQLSLINPSDKQRYESAWKEFIETPDLELDVTYRMLSKTGKWFWYRDVGKKVKFNNAGEPTVVTGTYTNVTKSVLDKGNLRLFGEAFKHTLDWVIIYDSDYQLVAYNDAFKAKFELKYDADAPTKLSSILENQPDNASRTWKELCSLKAGEHWKGEDKLLLPAGTMCDILVHINAVPNEHEKDKIEHLLVIMSDITEQKAAESKLRVMANFDALTGLPNRALLLDRINKGIEHAQRRKNNLAIFFIDLDKFKQVNDSLGHKAGDALLRAISKRLTSQLRKEDTVARLGGDEFVIMISEFDLIEDISHLVSEISTSIDLPVNLGAQSVSVSSSIGISLFPGDGASADELLKNADIAMYHAKEKGRSNFQFFTQEMNEVVKRRLELENQLKDAHKAKAFHNHYQVIINTQSKSVEGFEILLRWECNGELIQPDMFIPVSEELGLIESMTLDAIERAIPVLKNLYQKGFLGYMSFNLSARHFENQSSIETIIATLEQHNIPVNAIRFEITESALMQDYDKALTYMNQIREKGFLIALDDFGTGYSSLKYLKEFPINIIKIDKSFVDDIGKNQNNEAIILTTLSMAKQLNMSCVAEGIETYEHIEFFNQHSCHHLQGYYFSKPIPGEQAILLLDKKWPWD